MKFTVEKLSFEKAIMTALAAVSAKSSLPVLEGLLLEVTDKTLTVTGYDIEAGITSTIYCDVEEDGCVVLSGGKLADIVRSMPGETVTLYSDPSCKTEITSGSVVYNIIGTPAIEFPPLPDVMFDKDIRITEKALQSMIRQTVFSISTNETRPVFSGCLFEFEKEEMRVIAVDGYRLALRREKIENDNDDEQSVIIPGRNLTRLLRLLDESDNIVTIQLSSRHALFTVENNTLITNLIEGDFLNWRKAMAVEKRIEAVVDVKTVTDTVKRASLIISERQRTPIRFNFNDDNVLVTCTSPLGNFSDCFRLSSGGGEILIGFNNRYILDAFANTKEEQVRIEMKDSLSPLVIKPLEGDAFTFLVLPVKLRTDK